jgi:hypothetical protein
MRARVTYVFHFVTNAGFGGDFWGENTRRASLLGERQRRAEFCVGSCEGSDGFILGIYGDRKIFARYRISMNDQASPGHVENPIFDDGGAGIKRGLCVEIERQCCVGISTISLRSEGWGFPETIVVKGRLKTIRSGSGSLSLFAGTNIYGRFSLNEVRFKNLLQPDVQKRQ